MGQDDGDDRNVLERAGDAIKDAVSDPGGGDADSGFAGDAPSGLGLGAGGVPGSQGAVTGTLNDEQPAGDSGSERDF
jgi:hypothetical protein